MFNSQKGFETKENRAHVVMIVEAKNRIIVDTKNLVVENTIFPPVKLEKSTAENKNK